MSERLSRIPHLLILPVFAACCLAVSGCATDPAISAYKTRVKQSPGSAKERITLGLHYVKKKSYSLGRQHLEKGLKLAVANPTTSGGTQFQMAAQAVFEALEDGLSKKRASSGRRGTMLPKGFSDKIESLNEAALALADPLPPPGPGRASRTPGNRTAPPPLAAAKTPPVPDEEPGMAAPAQEQFPAEEAPAVDIKVEMRALRHPSWQRRLQAAKRLGEAREGEAMEPLLAALNTKGFKVRAEVAKALGKIGHPGAIPGLSRSATKDVSPAVRGWAVWSLGEIGDVTAEPALRAALRDKNKFVRASAQEALRKMGL